MPRTRTEDPLAGALALAALLAMAAGAPALAAGNVEHGRKLAEDYCDSCHPYTPADLADMELIPRAFTPFPDFDPLDPDKLKATLAPPHPVFDSFSDQDIADLVAFGQSVAE